MWYILCVQSSSAKWNKFFINKKSRITSILNDERISSMKKLIPTWNPSVLVITIKMLKVACDTVLKRAHQFIQNSSCNFFGDK